MNIHLTHRITADIHHPAPVTGCVRKPQHIIQARDALARAPSLAWSVSGTRRFSHSPMSARTSRHTPWTLMADSLVLSLIETAH
jgi:hypothetical protein